MQAQTRIVKPAIVMVEGPDDLHFLIELCRVRNLPDVQLIPYGGKPQLADTLVAVRKLPGFGAVESIGVIRDADGDRAAAIQSIQSALMKAGLKVPGKELTLHNGPPRTAYFVCPRAGMTGELEDSILESIPQHAALPCIESLLECAQKATGTAITKISKAKVRALLALQKEPLNLISEGAKAGVWPLDHVAFQGYVDLINLIGTAAAVP